jgi:hypothetical protein
MLLGSSASYEGVEATGGTETTYTDGGITYKVHTFSSTGTGSFVVGNGGDVDYLIVAGGGAGGRGDGTFGSWGGGGGAGGLLRYNNCCYWYNLHNKCWRWRICTSQ